jgi:SAM-dependent methyltransferase
MSAMQPPLSPAEEAYARLAPHYDELTREHDYEGWTRHLEDGARLFGLSGSRLLDAACGTGKSFLPFLGRGYSVTGCDISAEMVALASAKAPEAELFVADIRALDPVGSFDLVTCLDDSLNYLIDDGDLEAAFASLERNLAPAGVVVFDVNTLSTYRTTFACDMTLDAPDGLLVWRGRCDGEAEPGCVAELLIEAFVETGDGTYERITTRHLQRHHPRVDVEGALDAAGLRAVGVFGLLPDGSLDTATEADEDLHHKLIYYAQRVAKGGDSE